MGSYTRPDGTLVVCEMGGRLCEMLHFALSKPSMDVCAGPWIGDLGPGEFKHDFVNPKIFYFLRAECACWLLMPTPNSPAIVGLWTRTQCDGTTAFHVPVFVPRPPSPRIPDPTTAVIDLALSARPSPPTARNHGTMVRKSTALQLECITCWMHHGPSPSPPSPLPPLTWLKGPPRSVHLMPLS